jgi:hypothetical protein
MMTDEERFARLVEALRPWLDHLVFVGGWAHRLHRALPGLDVPPYQPLMTRDVDLAFAPRSGVIGDMRMALEAHGFHEQLSSDHRPPIASYHCGDDPSFYAEFLVPLSGSGVRRDGTPDATVIEAGVSAQKLRHLDLLLCAPYSVELSASNAVPVRVSTILKVPNPASFIAQKLLISDTRPPEKRASDLLYVHDTIELFADRLDRVGADWRACVAPVLARKTLATLGQRVARESVAVSDTLRRAASIVPGRALDPASMRALLADGLAAVFS